jgi:hypothetical protein
LLTNPREMLSGRPGSLIATRLDLFLPRQPQRASIALFRPHIRLGIPLPIFAATALLGQISDGLFCFPHVRFRFVRKYHQGSRKLKIAPDFFLSSNLSPSGTGLPFVVWFSMRPDDSHDPCVWISRTTKDSRSEFMTVSIRPDVRVLNGDIAESELDSLRRWIRLNRRVIEGHWNGKISFSKDAIDRIRHLEV